jgi:hypothetical protein
MPWYIRKRPNHNQYPKGSSTARLYKVYGERGNPLSTEWKTKAEAEKQLIATRANYYSKKK